MVFIWFLSVVGTGMLLFRTIEKRNDKSQPYVKYLSYLTSGVLGWVLIQMSIQLIYNEKIVFFLHEFKYVFIIGIGGLLYLFIFNLTENRPVERWKIFMFLGCYFFLLTVIFTNPYHHLFRNELLFISSHMNYVETDNNWFYTLVVSFNYTMTIIGVARLIGYHLRLPRMYKERSRLMITGILSATGVNLFYQITQIYWNFHVDFTPFSFFLISILFYFSIFVYQNSEISKMVKDLIKEEEDSGIMFLDHDKRIYYVNALCEEIIDMDSKEIIEEHISGLSGSFSDVIREAIKTKDKAIYQFAKDKIFVYEVIAREIVEEKKGVVGTVVTFEDITESEIERLIQT